MVEFVSPPLGSAPVQAPSGSVPVRAGSWGAAVVRIPDAVMPKVALERILWLMGKGTLSYDSAVVALVVMPRTGGGDWSSRVAAVAPVGAGFTGEGVLAMPAVVTGGVATMPLSGSGTLVMVAVGGYGRSLTLSGEGSLALSGVVAYAVRLQRVGEGSLSLAAVEVEYGAFPRTGTGSMGAVVVGVVLVPLSASGIGQLGMAAHAAYERDLALSGSGDLAMPAVGVTFKDSGITKTGQQQLPDSTWTLITGWTVRSGYPDTVIESDGIRVPAGTYTISAQTYWDRVSSIRPCGVRVTLDGTPIPGLEHTEAVSDNIRATTATVTISEGLVQIQGYSEGLPSYRRVNATDTWLTIENT